MNTIEVSLKRPGGHKTHLRSDIRDHTSISCTLLLIYMTFELNIKCVLSFNLTKTEWNEASDPVIITAHSLRQLQPGIWKILFKSRTEEPTDLLSALQEVTKFPHFKNTHPLTRHIVKELFRQCQSSIFDDQATSPKRNKANYN